MNCECVFVCRASRRGGEVDGGARCCLFVAGGAALRSTTHPKPTRAFPSLLMFLYVPWLMCGCGDGSRALKLRVPALKYPMEAQAAGSAVLQRLPCLGRLALLSHKAAF